MVRAAAFAVFLAAIPATAKAEDWRPITTNSKGFSSVDFDGLRGPPARRLAWVLHSLRATDPVLNYDFLMVRYAVNCDEETVQMLAANHYRLDGTLVHGDDSERAATAVAPGTTNKLLADAICSGERPTTAGYSSAVEATISLRRAPE